MNGKVDLHVRRIQLKALLPQVQAMRSSLGRLSGDASFIAAGNSVAGLLATSNGNVRLLLSQGQISRSLMELLGLNVGNYLVAKLFGDDTVKLTVRWQILRCVMGWRRRTCLSSILKMPLSILPVMLILLPSG